ncbi:MAG TPA: hypothetical protein VNB90_00445 [Cytophagaceae bacterium]|nr:hypothetical protein [Cytophagaceae bacterium]
MNKKLVAFLSGILISFSLHAQISPPGLGESNTAAWFAFGIRQRLDSANHKQFVSYAGLGRISGLGSKYLLNKQSIIVINEEYYNQFRKHRQYSLALSYRNQRKYEDLPPYESSNPAAKQEFRLYGRYSYLWSKSDWKLVVTFRQEIRKFLAPDFQNWDETLQLRSRLRTQLTFTLDQNKVHKLILSAEALGSVSQYAVPSHWSRFGYHESRFCFYYSLDPKNSSLVYSIGYMNNLLGTNTLKDVHYLAFDIIWENPFSFLKPRPPEALE